MVFRDEKKAVAELSELLLDAAGCLFAATRYIYALAGDAYYNCDAKDIFKVVLNNIRSADALAAFHLDPGDGSCAALDDPAYQAALRLTIHSFSVRLPALCAPGVGNGRMTEQQAFAVYNAVIKKSGRIPEGPIAETFPEIGACVRKGRPVAPYGAEWFRSYLYGAMPAFADISNRNLFFFGAADVLFYLFYLCLEKEFERAIRALCANNSD